MKVWVFLLMTGRDKGRTKGMQAQGGMRWDRAVKNQAQKHSRKEFAVFKAVLIRGKLQRSQRENEVVISRHTQGV